MLQTIANSLPSSDQVLKLVQPSYTNQGKGYVKGLIRQRLILWARLPRLINGDVILLTQIKSIRNKTLFKTIFPVDA